MCSLKWLWWLKAKSGQGSFLFLRVATIGKCHVAVLLAQSRHRVNKQVGWNWSSTLMHHNLSKDHTYFSGITCCLPSWGQKLVHLALPGGLQKTLAKARGMPTCDKVAVRGVWTLCTIINQKSIFLLVGFHTGLASWAHMLVLLVGAIEGSCLLRQSEWVAVHAYVPKIAYFVKLPILSTCRLGTGSLKSFWRKSMTKFENFAIPMALAIFSLWTTIFRELSGEHLYAIHKAFYGYVYLKIDLLSGFDPQGHSTKMSLWYKNHVELS
jgi:hypothetical protein